MKKRTLAEKAYYAGLEKEKIAAQIAHEEKLNYAILQVGLVLTGVQSIGKAAEIMRMPYEEFFSIMRRVKVAARQKEEGG